MKRPAVVALLVLLHLMFVNNRVVAQQRPSQEKAARTLPVGGPAKRSFSTASTKPYDVLHYDLTASLAMSDAGFHGTMVITVLITEATDSLWFHALGLVFDSLTVNDTSAAVSVDVPDETFSVHLPRAFAAAETARVRIAYERDVAFPRLVERQGYYWYPKNYEPATLENIGYTMSEPLDARLWMPCFDDPSDKATCGINVRVPAGYLAASNGLLTGVEESDSISVFHWKEDSPIATYLMCITASKFSTFSDYYHKVTNPAESLEVKYYMWQADSAGSQYNAVRAFSKVTEMMRVFSLKFGEFPFEKYGMAAVYPFQFGGMEHQTMTTVHLAWLGSAAYPGYENDIAHELAHQWWGDMVTCGTFKDIWLNESFATYAEALWQEGEYGPSAYNQTMNSFEFFDPSWQSAIYDPEGQGEPLFGSAEYEKGAWVLHMLRSILGDSLFVHTLQNYRFAYFFNSATTAQFSSVVSSTAGSDYSWFFNEWVFGPGWPTYAYRTVWDSASARYDLEVRQMQTSYPLFKMPIEVTVSYLGVDSMDIVWDSLAFQSFPLQAGVDSIQFDPRNRVLKQVVTWPTAVADGKQLPSRTELYQNFPNPFNPSTTIRYALAKRQFVELKIYDILGRVVRTLVSGVQEPGVKTVSVDAARLPSGVYMYRLQSAQLNSTKKMIIMR